jgi:hypothetical protein
MTRITENIVEYLKNKINPYPHSKRFARYLVYKVDEWGINVGND